MTAILLVSFCIISFASLTLAMDYESAKLWFGADNGPNSHSRSRRSTYDASLLEPLKNDSSVARQCVIDFQAFLNGIDHKISPGYSPNPKWAQLMYDSYGSPQGGILQNNLFWLGDFWQCLSIQVWRNEDATAIGPKPDFVGKYCLTSIVLIPLGAKLSLKVGMCIPSSCSADDVQKIIRTYSPLLLFVFLQENFCQTAELTPMDTTGLFIGTLFGFLFLLVLCATLYEWYLISIPTPKTTAANEKDILNAPMEEFSIQKVGCSRLFWKRFLLTFSAHKNTKSIFNVKLGGDSSNLTVVHGLRAFSMSWIVICHIFLVLHQQFPWKNQIQAATEAMNSILFQGILMGEFGVDSFFCMSGFLIAYLMLCELKKKNGKINILQYYFHRLWRLSPSYMLVIAYMAALYPYLGKGPIWPATFGDRDVCRKKWWQNLLYINVYFNEEEKCLPQVWYLCLDVVYYFLSPFILIPLFKKPRLGYFIFTLFFITSFLTPALLIHYRNLASFPANNIESWQRDRFMVEVYDKPWCRMSAFLVGMIYGYILYLKGTSMKMKPVVVIVGWLIAAALGLALIYGEMPYVRGDYGMSHAMFVIYGTFTRPAWAVMIGWIILTCCTGYGGVVNSVLSWRGFLPLSRLSYTAYLVHFTVLAEFYATRPDSTYIDPYNMTYYTIFMYIATMVVALVFTLISEAPFIAMEKLLINKPRNAPDKGKDHPSATLKHKPSPPTARHERKILIPIEEEGHFTSKDLISDNHQNIQNGGNDLEKMYERSGMGGQAFKRNKPN